MNGWLESTHVRCSVWCVHLRSLLFTTKTIFLILQKKWCKIEVAGSFECDSRGPRSRLVGVLPCKHSRKISNVTKILEFMGPVVTLESQQGKHVSWIGLGICYLTWIHLYAPLKYISLKQIWNSLFSYILTSMDCITFEKSWAYLSFQWEMKEVLFLNLYLESIKQTE